MSPIEKLARDICWAEFARKPENMTKARYWRDRVHPDVRAERIAEAERVVWIVKKFGTGAIERARQP